MLDFYNSNTLHFEIEKAGTITTPDGAVQVETRQNLPNVGKSNLTYFIQNENAVYRWDEQTLMYVCCGRNYEEISVIDGGTAAKELR